MAKWRVEWQVVGTAIAVVEADSPDQAEEVGCERLEYFYPDDLDGWLFHGKPRVSLIEEDSDDE